MKKTMLFSVALAGLMLGSCSSSDDLGSGGTSESKNGNGYVAFTINLPSQSSAGSRANDEFKDGLKSEYDVKDATLLLFDGTSESAATFSKAYKLNTAPWTAVGGNVTTTSATIVKKVDAPSSNYYALVVLNNNGVFDVDQDGKVTIGASLFTGTLGDFLKNATSADLTAKGFYMANAPLATKPGGSNDPAGAEVKTLVSLDGKIKETEADAKSAPVDIYVERAVAKVTMKKPTTVTKVEGSKPNGSSDEVKIAITDWVVDNTNKTSYLVRNTEEFSSWLSLKSNATTGVTNAYRFVGNSEVSSGLYRTYFAKDMNFEAAASGAFNDNSASMKSKFDDENPQYCFENTFDVENQKDNQTTRVLIKAELNDGHDFYVINGDENIIYKEDDVKKEIKKAFLTEYESWIKTNVTSPSTVGEDQLTVNISEAAGNVTINSIAITGVAYKTGVTSLPDGYQTAVMNKIGDITEYKNGESYYFVRIKHFGDDLTPWNTTETDKPSAASVYPTGTNRNGNYLGRYGVLRNNWYDIEVTGVKGLGSAKVPSVTTTTDDELESYIAVRINVLSWAKRTQSTVLH